VIGFTAMRTQWTAALLIVALTACTYRDPARVALPAAAQTPRAPAPSAPSLSSPLPPPTGAFKVGRSGHYVKGSPDLMLYVWYPAEASAGGQPPPYIAGWPQAQTSLRDHLQRMFRDAFSAFEQGRIFSFAIDGAPVARGGGRFPVIVFGHGLGVPGFAYAAQMEELASHGYVVAAVEYAPGAAFVLFPDGRVGSMNTELWNTIGKLPWESPELLRLERTEIEAGATALRTALDELTKLDAAGPLARRLDLSRVGVFGHSFGAMSAMRAAQVDRRFGAALTQDAVSPATLAFAAESGKQTRAKVGLFFRPIPANQRERIEGLFASYRPGTILVTPTSPGFAHMSFSDLLLLRAGDNSDTRASALRNLALVRALTRTFFDNALKGMPATPATLPEQGFSELIVRTSSQ
jgi:dienelactone hydrolase